MTTMPPTAIQRDTNRPGTIMMDPSSSSGAIVVVSKCPIQGKSKTRLIGLLGEAGSVDLAKAMLSDVLLTLHGCAELQSILKILLYAPGTREGFHGMTTILDELEIPWHQYEDDQCGIKATITKSSWLLLPMESRVDLQSSDLGDLLEHALNRVRGYLRRNNNNHNHSRMAPVVFLGMDSPVLPLDDIVKSLGLGTHENGDDGNDDSTTTALLCPASDGGYGMLSVPWQADAAKTFQQMLWSHSLTAIAQIKALSDQGIPVRIGTLMDDIDEPHDVEKLCQRLQQNDPNDVIVTKSVLDRPCGSLSPYETTTTTIKIQSSHPTHLYTRQALSRAGLLS